MSARLNLMQIHEIRKDAESGLTQDEIAQLRGLSRQTVWNALNNRIGTRQRQKADRMEYFLGGKAAETGNYRAKAQHYGDGNQKGGDVHLLLEEYDPVLSYLIVLEEIKNYFEEE